MYNLSLGLINMNSKFKFFPILLLLIFISGCATSGTISDAELEAELKEYEKQLEQEAVAEEQPAVFEYRINKEDLLEIGVWQGVGQFKKTKDKEKEPSGEYTVFKGDVLDISVWQWPDLDKVVIVRPDGKISFPLVGDVLAEGLTLTELDGVLTDKLKEFIKLPEVSVMVKEFGKRQVGFEKIEDLSKELIVRPDGKISLPLIGDFQAEGLTLNEVAKELTNKFSDYFDSPEVSVILKQIAGKKIIVLGEVKNPGVYKPTGPANILEAIALAGGFTEDAVLNSAILIRGAPLNPRAQRLNLTKAIERGKLTDEYLIEPEDIIYIPKKFIANLNYFMTQVIDPIYKATTAAAGIKTID